MSEFLRVEICQHIASMRRYAIALTRDPSAADDLVQEALALAIKGAGTFRPGAPLLPWLLRILRNAHLSERRRAGTRTEPLDTHAEMVATQPVADARIESSHVLRALMQLPQDQRAALTLVAVEELSYAEAASALGIPKGTLMSRLARARAALRALMEDDQQPRFRIIGGVQR